MSKKGQAAMEFIMTYGWAILVVLVAIAALAYFGVLSPGKYLPEKCMPAAGFSCIGSKATATGVELVLQNGLGTEIIVTDIDMPGATGCSGSYNITMADGATSTFTVSCTLTSGGKLNSDLVITYDDVTSGLTGLTNSGTITKKVQ
jgi:hypothetical protein